MDHAALFAGLKSEAEKIDATMRDDLAAISNELLAQTLAYALFNGGKRVRPLLTVFMSRLRPGREEQVRGEGAQNHLYRLAMVFEYLHAASLLHDDVIDRADKRRGKATANMVWGSSPAILAGDYLHARAMCVAGAEGGQEALGLLCHATFAMVEAEFLQMQNVEAKELSEARYFAVLKGKTSALIAAACEAGILAASGGIDERQAARVYGVNLGQAFQIVDDLLDYLGDPAKTGKAVGNDFIEGKMTLPLIHAIETGGLKERGMLLDLLSADRETRAREVETARAILQDTNGFAHAQQTAVRLIGTAQKALAGFPASSAREMLLGLSQYVLTREK